jgi:ubiquinone/menaquinone biosynthesis C-methylase UbiE
MQDVFTRRFDKPQHPDVGRYRTLLHTLSDLREYFEGRRVLDFGASYGVSMCALLELGAARVVGVEIDESRVVEGRRILADYGDRAQLLHTPDTTALPFDDGEFDCVLCNAVLEHIPQPRDAHIREMWRVLRPGGVLIVNETPNKYLPVDFHTLHLPLTNWLPSRVAHRIGVALGRFDPARMDWASSGWRGLGWYELVAPISDWELIPERKRLRHRVLTALGLPASLLDPYPCWMLRRVR